jgi:hypothetical protein
LIFCAQRVEFQLFAGSSYLNQLIAKTQNSNIEELAQEFYPCYPKPSSLDCPLIYSINSASDALSQGQKIAGYGSICEGCALVIMLVSFVVAGVLCIRRFYTGTTNKSTEAGRRVIKVRRQIIATVSTVFLTFLLRAVYAAALAVSRQSNTIVATIVPGYDPACNNPNLVRFCDPCQGLGLLVQFWLWLCPAFSFTVFSLSSPVTILVALWSMTTDSPLSSLGWKWSGFRKKATLVNSLESFIKAGGESGDVPELPSTPKK